MKSLPIASFLLLSSLMFGACSEEQKPADAPKAQASDLAGAAATKALNDAKALAQTSEIQVKVTGMTCTGCEQSIQDVLKAIPGVVDAKADHKTGDVKIQAQGPSESIKAQAIAAITQLNYEAK